MIRKLSLFLVIELVLRIIFQIDFLEVKTNELNMNEKTLKLNWVVQELRIIQIFKLYDFNTIFEITFKICVKTIFYF